jgi:putative oxidoreductase
MMKSIVKNLFNAGNYPRNIDVSLLILRLVGGSFMLTHGYGKFLQLFGEDPIQFADPVGLGVTFSLVLAVFAEFFCSLFLIVGMATRLASIPLIITMSVAGFIVHGQDAFGVKEMALLYLVIFVIILLAGAGKYSIDNWIDKKLNH